MIGRALTVELIRLRQAIHKNDIRATVGAFDDFEPSERFDAIFFYECLHHAMKPWELIARARRWLYPGGKIVFAGEPINTNWWRHWGLRLDAESVYCIRKFGWFESGWSENFIVDCFQRAGLNVNIVRSSRFDVGAVCVATKTEPELSIPASQLQNIASLEGWYHDGDYLTSTGEATIAIRRPEGVQFLALDICNFRPKPISLTISKEGEDAYSSQVRPGKSSYRCALNKPVTTLRFASDVWKPAAEIGN